MQCMFVIIPTYCTSMAHKDILINFMFFSIATVCLLSCTLIECTNVAVEEYLHLENIGTVKTIKSEDGDVIDCVLIHKQPAFDHPLVKSIQLKPSSYPNGTKPKSSQNELNQLWHKNGKCPKGTIPIIRTPKRHFHRAFPVSSGRRTSNQSIPHGNGVQHEYATAEAIDNDKFYGGQASINVWNPTTWSGEFSLSQIWLVSNSQQGLNTIEAGWIVYPDLYGDKQTRFFVYWTSDGYRKTGCYNLGCPGFVQTNKDFALGFAINPVSSQGNPYEMTMTIFQDKPTGNWWLMAQDIFIGYWPGSIFTGFAQGASILEFGGEIINRRYQDRHTITKMGSGHFPEEGFGKSSYFRNILFVDKTNTLRHPQQVIQSAVSNPLCYDILMGDVSGDDSRINFYYGGQGLSSNCP